MPLAIILESPLQDGQRILLTGDARYSAIPSALEQQFASIVVFLTDGSYIRTGPTIRQ